jgi:hypothetical protein
MSDPGCGVRDAAASILFFRCGRCGERRTAAGIASRFKHLRTKISVRQRTISSNRPEII